MIKSKLIYFIKIILKRNYRKKFLRELKIKIIQNKSLIINYQRKTKRLVVFVLPSADFYGNEPKVGGILSINSIFQETEKLKDIFGYNCILVTESAANIYASFSFFESDVKIYRYEQLDYFNEINEVILNIPEYLVPKTLEEFKQNNFKFIKRTHYLHIN